MNEPSGAAPTPPRPPPTLPPGTPEEIADLLRLHEVWMAAWDAHPASTNMLSEEDRASYRTYKAAYVAYRERWAALAQKAESELPAWLHEWWSEAWAGYRPESLLRLGVVSRSSRV